MARGSRALGVQRAQDAHTTLPQVPTNPHDTQHSQLLNPRGTGPMQSAGHTIANLPTATALCSDATGGIRAIVSASVHASPKLGHSSTAWRLHMAWPAPGSYRKRTNRVMDAAAKKHMHADPSPF
eukprot:scaffold29153_cov107-Isochrysis_galbana.AAC.2